MVVCTYMTFYVDGLDFKIYFLQQYETCGLQKQPQHTKLYVTDWKNKQKAYCSPLLELETKLD